ncbi:MAG TPA: hypothetical protein VH720_14975 [Candidatus Limnocylindrales bacterium]|jgi:hypothetical protein
MPVSLFPLLLVTHVTLAVVLFLPSLLLPFTLRASRPATTSGSTVVQRLLWLQANGTVVVGGGLAVTGLAMLLVLGPGLLAQPWLLVALSIYAANLALAFFIQRPGLRRIVGVTAAWDDDVWHARARRQRYLSYAMAALVGVIGFLMSTKPQLW